MDLAVYINELLGLKGEVNVPGVGLFAQKRINGYYSDSESKFYPPRHEIVFDPVPREDEGLADYISQKKNISPASAKYFIEKYATGLKQEASSQSAAITGLGHLFYEYSALTFKADKNAEQNDPAFYGFAPVKLYKTVNKPAETPPVVKTEQMLKPDPVKEQVMEEQQQSVFDPPPVYEEEEIAEEKKHSRAWIVVLLVVIIGLLCFGVVYQYKPEWFGKSRPVDTMIIVNGPKPAAKKLDTTKTIKTDTPKTAAIDTYAVVRYEIQAGTFKTMTKINSLMKQYEGMGLHPRLVQHSIGLYHKITLGTYFDKQDGIRVEDSIKKIPGINPNDISLQPYNPVK